jgi:tripartite-type tricarboxylate transporter receptor subunit TctC
MVRKLVLALSFACAAAGALAQDWPAKPIQVIVPFPTGPVDAKARIVAEKVGKILGQPLVIVNKPGAGMQIGTKQLLDAPNDGYTLGVMVQANSWITPTLLPDASYDANKDLTPISIVLGQQMVLVASNKLGVHSMAELVKLAQAKPGVLNYGAPSGPSGFHVWFEVLKGVAKLDIVFVPYRGLALALQDLIGGQVDVGLADLGSMQLIQAGRMKALAVTGERRLSELPDVPTLRELGFPFVAVNWLGFAAPANLPKPVEQRLVKAFDEALRSPDVRKALEGDGTEAIDTARIGPAEFRARITNEPLQFRQNVKPGTFKLD